MKVSLPVKMTLEDLDRMPNDGNRYELIDGDLFVTASPFAPHQRVVTRLLLKLGSFVEQKGAGEVFVAPFDVHLTIPRAEGATCVEPDLLFISKARQHIVHRHVHGAPDLVVEVVSESSARADYFDKRDAYRAAGVREYWIVDTFSRGITVHRFETSEPARELSENDTLTTPLLPGFELPVGQVFE